MLVVERSATSALVTPRSAGCELDVGERGIERIAGGLVGRCDESDADSELGTSASAVTTITVMSAQKDFERSSSCPRLG